MFPERILLFGRRYFTIGLFTLLPFLAGCLLPTLGGPPEAGITNPEEETEIQPVFLLLFPGGSTPTPFQPIPVTGTPPPTSTPFPTPAPPATATPTPWLQPTFAPPSVSVSGVPAPFPLLSADHQINFLLLGSDSRGGASFRTDVVMIVIIDPEARSVTLISIPRDLYVYIPGWTMNRVNTAYLHGEFSGYPGGGPGLIKDTILYNLGIRIDHVALVDFDGFRRVVDRAGGIDVPVLCPFTEWAVINPNVSIEYESNWELITIGPGVVHMDGDMALWYSRARQRSNDFDRGRRQQEVIRALYAAAIETNLILQAPELYEDFRETVRSDVSLQTIISLVPLGLDLDPGRVRSFYIGDDLTWGWMTPGGASVLLPDSKAIFNMLLEAVAPPEEPAQAPIVEIWNRSSTPNLDVLAAERLHYRGYETILLPPSDDEVNKTRLYALRENPDAAQSSELLSLFDLSPGSLVVELVPSEARYRLVLGSDFDPCFNPATDN